MGFWTRLFGDGDRKPTRPPGGSLANGKKHGVWIEEDRSLLVERTYRDGVLNGPSRSWRSTGDLWEKATYVDGNYDGVVRRFYENGKCALEAAYAGGKLHGPTRTFTEAGEVESELEYRDDQRWHGTFELVYAGKLCYRHHYQQGKRVGLCEEYHPGGKLAERGTYVDGKRHGMFELGDERTESWRGEMAMDERVGIWEMTRDDGSLTARGEWPRNGATTTWEVKNRKGATATVEISSADAVPRWIELARSWLDHRSISDFKGWSREDRLRAARWLDAQLAARSATDEREDRGHASEAAARDKLVYATGSVAKIKYGRQPRSNEDEDYMSRWYPPRKGSMKTIATIALPRRVILDSSADATSAYTFRAGAFEVVALDTGARLDLPLVVIRAVDRPPLTSWRYIGTADDDYFSIVPTGAELGSLEVTQRPKVDCRYVDGVFEPDLIYAQSGGPHWWVRCEKTTDGEDWVSLENPTGNGIRVHAALAGDEIVALFFQLY